MYQKIYNSRFRKSIKKIVRSGRISREEIELFIDNIAAGKPFEQQHEDHALIGEWLSFRECHIKPDLLLIYKIEKNILILLLADIGSHSNLFGK